MRLDFDFGIKSLHGVGGVFVYKETYSDLINAGYYAEVKQVEGDVFLIDGVRWIDIGNGLPIKEDAIINEVLPPNDTILFASKESFNDAVNAYVRRNIEIIGESSCY